MNQTSAICPKCRFGSVLANNDYSYLECELCDYEESFNAKVKTTMVCTKCKNQGVLRDASLTATPIKYWYCKTCKEEILPEEEKRTQSKEDDYDLIREFNRLMDDGNDRVLIDKEDYDGSGKPWRRGGC